MTEQEMQRVGSGQAVLIYVRESQYNEHERVTIEDQLAACTSLAESLDYAVFDELVVIERGPNSSMTRAGITTMIGHVAASRVGAVITYTLDRLGRPASDALEALVREFRRREVPLYIARTPGGYSYDPLTGKLAHDPEAIHAATLREWQPPAYIIIPRENEQDERFAEHFPRLNKVGEISSNGQATEG